MKKKIVILGIVSVIYIIFFPFIYNNMIHKQYVIEISPACDKNEKSFGNEVWINRIIIDGRNSELSQYILDDGWENRGRLFSAGNTKNILILKIHAKEKITIEFISHPYSGIVKVRDYNGNENIIDLYSDIEGTTSIDFVIDK